MGGNSTANSDFQGKVKKISIRYSQPAKAITVKFFVWENTTRKELHPLELTSKPSTEFAYNGTSRGVYKERYCRLEVISQWFPTFFDAFLPLLIFELFIPPS